MAPWHILRDPFRNKGTAFTEKERDFFQLHGKLPYHISTIEEQVERRYINFKAQSSDLAKHLFLSALHQRNEILFYKLISEHISEMLPLIYTPTVGDYSVHFSYLYTEPRGLYLSYPQRDQLEQIFSQIEAKEIDVIVVTDGQRILGLGDLGAGGMAIPVGKLSLYTLFGGLHPQHALPILLDVGTDNPTLLNDPLYLGWRHPRIGGEEYDRFIEAFVQAVKKRFPHVLLQWEDFGREHAKPLLDRYRKTLCSFNDDIQGTAAVVLAALHAAVKQNHSQFHEQRIVLFGGGSAGTGIAHYLLGAMEASGIPREKLAQSLYLIDINGLVHTGLTNIPPHQRPFVQNVEEIKKWTIADINHVSLLEVVHAVHPTTLIGVSAQSGVFNENVIKAMARYVERPIIFPLSNPPSKSEAHPLDLLEWTEGRAIIATGSPFKGVSFKGQEVPIAQCNNVYIYPGIGLGAVACKAKEITDTMFYKAAEILGLHSPMHKSPAGTLFPSFENLRSISREIALGVVSVAQEEGLAPKTDPKTREHMVDQIMWTPTYAVHK